VRHGDDIIRGQIWARSGRWRDDAVLGLIESGLDDDHCAGPISRAQAHQVWRRALATGLVPAPPEGEDIFET